MQLPSPVRLSVVADRSACAPMTWGQIAMWDVLEWLHPDEALLNPRTVLRTPRGTTVNLALKAIRQLVLRHESLRTSYISIDGNLTQRVKDEVELDVFVVEAPSGRQVRELSESALAQLASDTFDLSAGVQLRAALIARDGFVLAIALAVSHMAVDASSFLIVLSELQALLSADGDLNRLPERSQQPVERAEFEASPAGAQLQDRVLAFWRQAVSLASPASLSELPGPADDHIIWASIESEALTLAAHQLAARYTVSPSAVILASLGLLISDFTGEPGPIVRSLTATRFRPHDRQFVGAFNLNSVVHVATGSELFADHVRRTGATITRAFLHCEANPRLVEEVVSDAAADRGIISGSCCYFNDTASGRITEPHPAAVADPARIAAATARTRIAALPYQGRLKGAKFFLYLESLRPACLMRLCKDRRFIPDVSPSEFFRSLENLMVEAAAKPSISVRELLERP
jgi:condensation domain-containing protein